LTKKPKYILEDKCTGCTTCVENCPVTYPDVFNQQISMNKAIHIYFPQAIPLVAYIDESCIYLKEKKCRICTAVCKNDAIDFNQRPQKKQVNVGAIILAPGIEPFDPKVREEYRYGQYANVITSLDYERLLSSTGPFQGEVLRPSDGKHPKNIAWIQCVGSRQILEGANSYCSAVCCTYTQKQVILTKDHSPDSECTVFHNDIRAYGKDFERYYDKAESLPGVRFIRSYVTIGKEIPGSKNVTIRYATNDDGVKEEEFDMVVLSVGLNPPKDFKAIAAKFGIGLESHGFCRTDPVNPIETTRPGVFISGAFQGPVDIPESVFGASGAGARVGELLRKRRGGLSKARVYPTERDVAEETPKIGVFVCHCGANIGRIVNVPSVVEYALSLPNVVYAQEQLFSCATNSAQQITDLAREKGLNRVVVAACSPRTLEPLFRDTVREAGINQYFFEMANIREHCSWVHSKEKEKATEKAKDIVRMSVARACLLEPLREYDLPVNKAALVVGGGIAGMTCALSIANQGHEVYLLEKDSELGGMAKKIRYTLEGVDPRAVVLDLIEQIHKHPMVHVYTGASITEATGYVGNFTTSIRSTRGPSVIKHGAAVLAIGADLYTPTEYLYGQDEKVLTQVELEQKIGDGDPSVRNCRSLAMIQCVGCRQEDRNYCSRICCGHAVKNALKFREMNPEADIHIYFRDMRTYGLKEDFYREASEKDIKFIRYEPSQKPVVEAVVEEGRPVLRVSAPDPVLGQMLAIDADLLALSAAFLPAAATTEMASLFKVPLSPDGFFKEAHVKLKPVDFGTDGVYLCGAAHYPKFMKESVSQACGAAGRVLTLLSRDTVVASGSVCEVDKNMCVSCGACITVCNYGAIEFEHTPLGRKAVVNPVLCKGDGVCNTKCPTNAIQLKHFTDEELLNAIDAAME
jgi:heterodisulfide reductase subunit A